MQYVASVPENSCFICCLYRLQMAPNRLVAMALPQTALLRPANWWVGSTVISVSSAPIEASHIINIRFSIYSGTDRVRLNFFFWKKRIIGYSNVNFNSSITTVECSNEITITITITDKNYNYNNNYEIFIISDYICVYANHAIDKQYRPSDRISNFCASNFVDILYPHF